MAKEGFNQPQTVEELIRSILADEAQIISYLKVFFCKTLQEIATEKYMTPERKVKLGSDLISSAAQKEAALAAVLDAISKIIDEEHEEWITLKPGASYQVTSLSPTITAVMFTAITDIGVTGGEISAVFEGIAEIGSTDELDEVPSPYTIYLGSAFHTDDITLKNTGESNVYIRNVVAS